MMADDSHLWAALLCLARPVPYVGRVLRDLRAGGARLELVDGDLRLAAEQVPDGWALAACSATILAILADASSSLNETNQSV